MPCAIVNVPPPSSFPKHCAALPLPLYFSIIWLGMAGQPSQKWSAYVLPHDLVLPLTHKWQRLEQESQPPVVGVPGPTPFTSSLTLLADPSADANLTSGGIIFVPPSLPTLSLVPMSMPPGLAASLARLEAESHKVRARQSKAM